VPCKPLRLTQTTRNDYNLYDSICLALHCDTERFDSVYGDSSNIEGISIDLTEKKQTDTRETGTLAKSQDESAYTKSIIKSQDKIGSPSAIKKELQRPCHRVLSFEKIKRNKKECKGHARGKK